MKFENTEVFNFDGAFRGMRNPMNSWDKSDSFVCFQGDADCSKCPYFIDQHSLSENICLKEAEIEETDKPIFIIGKNDLKLAQTLIKAGSEHRKFMRQIFISVDITAPLYWWKEFDTYKVGTVSNSTSTMHKLASTLITIDCFEMDDFENVSYVDKSITISTENIWEAFCWDLEQIRLRYVETKDKRFWKELIRLLPESWLQKRTITMNYENVLNMVHQRRNHKLTEWSESFFGWAKSLPYADELLFME